MAAPRESLEGYLAFLRRERAEAFAADPPLRRAAKRLVPEAVVLPVRLAATALVAPRERRKAEALRAAGPVRLHLGASSNSKAGWTDVDLLLHPVDLAWNLLRPLPFPDSSVAAVFSEHVLEHLAYEQALALLRECRRVLAAGGVLRVAVPDAGRYLRAYPDDPDGFIERNRPARPTPLLAIQEAFTRHGHRSAYDLETLALLFRTAGFLEPRQAAFGESALEPCPDSESRAAESLYVEAAA